jgi:NAD(P)-dependent dehydrogenase (short-subunit alcohol dehydrogenase family)
MPQAALVTGAAVRVGRSIALELARAGFDIAIHYRSSRQDAERTVADIEALGRRAIAVEADLGDEPAIRGVVPRATEALGPLGLLVNNASIIEPDHLDSMTSESFDRHMDVHLRGPAFLSQGFAAQLPAGAEGVIVNMIDERVINLTPNYFSYSISKVGLWAMTQLLARSLAPRIRVNAIGPGPALKPPDWPEDRFQALVDRPPLKRATNPEEIARTVRFILETPSMTGQLLTLDGGKHLGWLTEASPGEG